MKACWFCGSEIVLATKVTRESICPKCKVAVKCCKNCGFFETSAHNQCREPAAEWVRDKELSNFCEYFDFLERAGGPPRQKDDARSTFDSLFKKK